jgi:hypothetical protein
MTDKEGIAITGILLRVIPIDASRLNRIWRALSLFFSPLYVIVV